MSWNDSKRERRLGLRLMAFSLTALLGLLLVGCSGRSNAPAPNATNLASPSSVPGGQNDIASENARPGTDAWQISNPAFDGEIAGYAGQTSYNRGETVDLHISTRVDGTRYSIEVYRMGWYGGLGARLVRPAKSLTGQAQGYWSATEGLHACLRCRLDRATGLLDTNWDVSYKLKLDRSWPSGVYMARLQDENGKQALVPFVVRDDERRTDLLVQISVNTWQAYNAWGDRSLYGAFDDTRGWQGKDARAYKVSYNRPYDPKENDVPEYGAGEFFRFEYDFVRWAESQGYDMTYATDVDLHARPGLLQHRHGFVSIGHDEYWSWDQRSQVEVARDAGVGLAFLGGNDVYWQVRFEPDAGGESDRTLVCYKDAALDPTAQSDPARTTVLWAADPVNLPQSLLTGTTYGTNATPQQQDWAVNDASSWVFVGSGLADGDTVHGIVGYEYDRLGDEAQQPAALQVVGLSSVNGWEGWDQTASVAYVAASGAVVFSAGTIQWPWALDDFGHEDIGLFADQRLQIVTRNVLDALARGVQ